MTTATLTTETYNLPASLTNDYYDYEARLEVEETIYWVSWNSWLEANPF